MRRSLFALLVVALLVPVGAASAAGQPHLMTGRWMGFVQGGVEDPNIRGPLELTVLSQDRRRFVATIQLPQGPTLPPNPCALEGTVSASLNVSATGDCDGSKLELHGRVTEELQDGFIVPCVFEGRWTLKGPEGKAEGTVGLLHLEGGPTHLATGHYEGSARHGEATPPDPIRADLGGSRTGGEGTGRFEVGDASFDVFFDVAVHEGSDTHGLAMVAGGEAGMIIVGGRFLPAVQSPGSSRPAMIEGTHVLMMPDGTSLEGTFSMSQGNPPEPV